MELTYKNEELKRLCEDASYNNKLVREYGIEVAKKLPQRIMQLKAFASVGDIPVCPPFRRHKLEGNRKETFAVNVNGQYRIIFRNKDSNRRFEKNRKYRNFGGV